MFQPPLLYCRYAGGNIPVRAEDKDMGSNDTRTLRQCQLRHYYDCCGKRGFRLFHTTVASALRMAPANAYTTEAHHMRRLRYRYIVRLTTSSTWLRFPQVFSIR